MHQDDLSKAQEAANKKRAFTKQPAFIAKALDYQIERFENELQESPNGLEWECSDCNHTVFPLEVPYKKTKLYRKAPYCSCAVGQAKKHQAQVKVEQDQHQEKSKGLVTQFDIVNPGYIDYRFTNWDITRNDSETPYSSVLEYVDRVEMGQPRNWIYLYGDYGLGKTHLAVAACRKILGLKHLNVEICNWARMTALINDSYRIPGEPADIEAAPMSRYNHAQVLLIDDIDKITSNDKGLAKLYATIDYRLTYKKPTIITANRCPDSLGEMWLKANNGVDLGLAITSRIVGQLMMGVEFKGQDQRVFA